LKDKLAGLSEDVYSELMSQAEAARQKQRIAPDIKIKSRDKKKRQASGYIQNIS